MGGIYKIENKINGKCYYGSAIDIEKRWKKHKNRLNNNSHENVILQRAWNKYGKDNFIFSIVEECHDCDRKSLYEAEQKYLTLESIYNIGKSASGGDNITKHPKRDVVIKNIKNGYKKWLENLTPEERKAKFSKPKESNSNWRGGSSDKRCACGTKIGYGHVSCIKCMNRSGKNNPFYGKTHSEENKKKAIERQTGIYNGKQNLPIVIDNVEYRSAGEASKILKIPSVTIRWRVLSKNIKFENYKYKTNTG